MREGYTGAGNGSVGQNLDRINRAANNRLFVAQQQHRLNYFGFVSEGGGQLTVDGLFGPATDSALRTFQAVFVAGVNTTQASVDGIVGPNTAGWLNAANAPTWEELIDPDPQRPGGIRLSITRTQGAIMTTDRGWSDICFATGHSRKTPNKALQLTRQSIARLVLSHWIEYTRLQSCHGVCGQRSLNARWRHFHC